MKKSDLKPGMVVEDGLGDRYIVSIMNPNFAGEIWPSLDGYGFNYSRDYTENLVVEGVILISRNELKIVKVYEDYTCSKVLWERKEKPVLTEDEKVILKNINPMYKYIARDNNGKLFIYAIKPNKMSFLPSWTISVPTISYEDSTGFNTYRHLFDFIKWEDEEPYSIKYLLGESDINE